MPRGVRMSHLEWETLKVQDFERLEAENQRLRVALEQIQMNVGPLAKGGPTVGPAAWYFQIIDQLCTTALEEPAANTPSGEGGESEK